jgi:hypothetical protein
MTAAHLVALACCKPKELGYAAELWTLSALAEHARAHAHDAGFDRLARAGKTTVWRILDAHELKPTGCATTSRAATRSSSARWPKC